jgi:hypothetical protein
MATTPTDLDVTSDLGGVFLRKSDVEDGPQRFSIAAVTREHFEARNGRPAQDKVVLAFAGDPTRKMSLNKTNLGIIARAWGKQASAWIGRSLLVELDESVQFAGQLVGGLRVRIPKVTPAAKRVAPPATPTDVPGDDVDFLFGGNVGDETGSAG